MINREPQHIAIIMDGNMRWANKQSLPSIEGYRSGMENTRRIILAAIKKEIKYISLFALSSENLKRPAKQTRDLLKIFDEALDDGVPEFHEKGARFSFIGELKALPASLQQKMKKTEKLTAKNSVIHINLAINYGGKWDIKQACNKIAKMIEDKKIKTKNINEDLLERHLCLASQPAIDLCIRTGNEKRLSNFLLWQMAYTELYFSKVYWPDFSVRRFQAAIADYKKRDRRFGSSALN